MAETKMTRIEMSDDEWRELRKAALDENISTQTLIGKLIREYLADVAEGAAWDERAKV